MDRDKLLDLLHQIEPHARAVFADYLLSLERRLEALEQPPKLNEEIRRGMEESGLLESYLFAENGVRYRVSASGVALDPDPGGFRVPGPVARELLPVVEELISSQENFNELARRIVALEEELTALRQQEALFQQREGLIEERGRALATLEDENQELRAVISGAPGLWVAEGAKGERAAVLAYLRSCVERSDDRRAATIQRLCEELGAGEHLKPPPDA